MTLVDRTPSRPTGCLVSRVKLTFLSRNKAKLSQLWYFHLKIQVYEVFAVSSLLVHRRQADPHRLQFAEIHSGGKLWRDHQDAHQWASPGEEDLTDPGSFRVWSSLELCSLEPCFSMLRVRPHRNTWTTTGERACSTLPSTHITSLKLWGSSLQMLCSHLPSPKSASEGKQAAFIY